MIEWKYTKLKQLIQDIGDGGTPSTSDNGNFGGSINWAVVDDVKPEIYTTKETLTEKGYKRCSAKLWPVDSIILTTGATIGEVGITKIELCTKQGITGIVPNKWANNLFLRYWLENNKQQLVRYSQGTTFKEIRPRPLGNLRIKMPEPFTETSVKTQEKIASILSTVDKNIEQTKKTIEKAERLKKSMIQNLLTGKIKPDGTKRQDNEFYFDEKFGKVPIGWKLKFIGDSFVSKINPNYPFKKGKHYDFLPMEAVLEKYQGITCFSKRKIETGGLCRFKNNDVLFAKITPCTENGKITLVKKTDSELGFGSTEFIVISPSRNIISEYLYNFLLLNKIHGKTISLMEGTTGRQRVPLNIFRKNLKIIFPEEFFEQKKIVEKLEIFQNKITINNIKILKLQKLKKSLMQNLLTGKIEVN